LLIITITVNNTQPEATTTEVEIHSRLKQQETEQTEKTHTIQRKKYRKENEIHGSTDRITPT